MRKARRCAGGAQCRRPHRDAFRRQGTRLAPPGLLLARRQALGRDGAHPARDRLGCAHAEGGYRAYRRAVVAELRTLPAAFEFRVVHGPTGSGKSRLLGALRARRRAGARPRGPRRPPRLGARQSARPAAAVAEMVRKPAAARAVGASTAQRPVFVEGESKKIGQLQVPEALIARMRASRCVLLETAARDARHAAAGRIPAFPCGPGRARSAARLPRRPARPRKNRRMEGARRAQRLARVRQPRFSSSTTIPPTGARPSAISRTCRSRCHRHPRRRRCGVRPRRAPAPGGSSSRVSPAAALAAALLAARPFAQLLRPASTRRCCTALRPSARQRVAALQHRHHAPLGVPLRDVLQLRGDPGVVRVGERSIAMSSSAWASKPAEKNTSCGLECVQRRQPALPTASRNSAPPAPAAAAR